MVAAQVVLSPTVKFVMQLIHARDAMQGFRWQIAHATAAKFRTAETVSKIINAKAATLDIHCQITHAAKFPPQ
jgi:hypothetical protein